MSNLHPEMKFGKLTVVSWDNAKKAWLCNCDCGSSTYARAIALKNGTHASCACGKVGPRTSTRLLDNLGPKRNIFRSYKFSAKRRGYAFELSEERFFGLITANCFYCGIQPQT